MKISEVAEAFFNWLTPNRVQREVTRSRKKCQDIKKRQEAVLEKSASMLMTVEERDRLANAKSALSGGEA